MLFCCVISKKVGYYVVKVQCRNNLLLNLQVHQIASISAEIILQCKN